MSKYCGKCGAGMDDDDFLCPACGAIWGDRIYRAPVAAETAVSFEDESDMPEEQETPAAPAVPTDAPARNKKHPWLVPLIVILLGLVLTLSLIRANIFPEGTEGSSVPTTTTEHITIGQAASTAEPATPPVTIVAPDGAQTYYFLFVDQYRNPIEGIRISNPLLWMSSGYMASNSYGLISFRSYMPVESIQILSVPDGYSDAMVNEVVSVPEGQTMMTIIIYKTDDPVIEIDPP